MAPATAKAPSPLPRPSPTTFTTPKSSSDVNSSPRRLSPTPRSGKISPKYKSCRRTTPRTNSYRKSVDNQSTSTKTKKTDADGANVQSKNDNDDRHSRDTSFQDHARLCDRMAKSFYFNKLPSTPRPSLPLTMLAVNTFTSMARKDTLEYLELEKAAEIGRNACVTPTALIMALVYLERLSHNNPGYLGSVKPSELFVVSLLVASKFVQDDGEDLGIFNDEWATSADIQLKKLNKLELEFLTAIDWNVNVGQEDYGIALSKLEENLALEEGCRRGWFTYTEVASLTNSLLAWNLIWPTLYQQCIKVITAAYMTYATVLATMLTSTFLAPQIFMMTRTFLTSVTAPASSPVTYLTTPCYLNSSLASQPLPLLEEGDDNDTETDFQRFETLYSTGGAIIGFQPHLNLNPYSNTQPSAKSKHSQLSYLSSRPQLPLNVNKYRNPIPGVFNEELEFEKQIKNLLKMCHPGMDIDESGNYHDADLGYAKTCRHPTPQFGLPFDSHIIKV